MRVEIGAVLYALGATLVVYSVVLMCRRRPHRIPYFSWRHDWRWDSDRQSGEFWSSLGGVLLFVFGFELLTDHSYWPGFGVLVAPIVVAQLIVIARHNRDVARAAELGLHPQRPLTGPNSSI